MSKDSIKVPIVGNALGPNGEVLCPECGRGAVWKNPEDGKMYTSPMQKMEIPGKVKALVHRSCGQAVIRKAFAAHTMPPAGTPAPKRDTIEIKEVAE